MPNRRWASELVDGRPYRSSDELLEAADASARRLTDAESAEAIAVHPRIGEGGGHAPQVSTQEQSRAQQAPRETLDALAVENRRYEDRFGHVFLIAASGRSGEEILAELRRRMSNDRTTELGEARRELRKIVRLRIGKMLSA